jgi:hypothetical protein
MKYNPPYGLYRINHVSFMIALLPFVVGAGLIFSPFVLLQTVAAQPSIIKDPNLRVESVLSGLSSYFC